MDTDTAKLSDEKLPLLETICAACDGTGILSGKCFRCNGVGAIPTEFGDRILSFVIGHRRSILSDDD
jgi:hypothetical protein